MDDQENTRGTPGQRKRAEELVRLAEAEFGELRGEEHLILRSAAKGGSTKFDNYEGKPPVWNWESLIDGDEPWKEWDSRAIVRSTLIRWLCTDKSARLLVSLQGVSLDGAWLQGELDLQGADIPFSLSLFRCAIPEGIRLFDARLLSLMLDGSFVGYVDAGRVIVRGSVHFRNNFCSTGEIHLCGSKIQGNLSLRNSQLGSNNLYAVDISTCVVEMTLFIDGIVVRRGIVAMGATQADTLWDNLSDWPEEIVLTGFQYRSIYPNSVGTLNDRLAWLAKHDSSCVGAVRFDPQPYRQLAKVLRHSGHDQFADKVMYAASRKQAKSRVKQLRDIGDWVGTFASLIMGFIYWAYDRLTGYGYKRWNPFFFLVGMIVLGAIIFSGLSAGAIFGSDDASPIVMQPTQALALANEGKPWLKDYPAFRPLAYSADAFLPLVNLHQETYWTPKHWAVKRVYLPFHILAGWIVTTLAAVSVTGLVRHEKE